jgi:uncharacterized NAD(P)/FAD-binding protein YdhS
MKSIAIIGSGPAGCYLADHLLRLIPDASIDVLEKLPVPFGLIRYGVAPDHQSTKASRASSIACWHAIMSASSAMLKLGETFVSTS